MKARPNGRATYEGAKRPSRTRRARAESDERSESPGGAKRRLLQRAVKWALHTMAPKSVALTGAVCVTVGWLLASMLAPPVAQLQSRGTGRASRATSAPDANVFTETLQLKLQRQESAAPTVRRNPFVFGARERLQTPGSSTPSAFDRPADPPAAPTVVAPPYSLSGVGETQVADEVVRTAVLSDGTTVYLVKAGETVGAYSVVAVDAYAVTLADAAGARFVIRLRN